MSYNIFIETYGCSANQSNSEIMKGLLFQTGFNIVENKDFADIVILNTCVVKEPTIKKIEERIKYFEKNKKKLIIAGCMPEVLLNRIRKIAPRASIVSTHHIKEIVKVVRKLIEDKRQEIIGKNKEIKLCMPRIPQNKIIGITQICQGCVNSCFYCLVKYVKGSLFSYPEEMILKDIKQTLEQGAKEIWLTSQDNAAYGLDENKYKLPELLQKILNLKGNFFVRLGMLNPSSIRPITKEMIQVYKHEKMFKFLHMPIQSGSDKILKAMNRKYKINQAIKIIQDFKKVFPEITISTDIIVGFPGETEKDFQETIKAIQEIKPDILNISKFWPLPGTEASRMQGQVPLHIKKARATKLMNVHARIALQNNKKLLGKEYKVLVDEKGFQDTWLSRNENYKLIIIKSKQNLLGKFLKVRIKEAKAHYLIGEIISKSS